jgi:hypothetical protein
VRGGIAACALWLLLGNTTAVAQDARVEPRVLSETEADGRVTVVEVATRFVTTIRLPDSVSSVVVGDPSEFQVEHSEREPRLVFVKAIARTAGATNLLISTTTGHQVNLLLVNRGEASGEPRKIDFLVRYEPPAGFFVPPSGFPFALIGATVPLLGSPMRLGAMPSSGSATAQGHGITGANRGGDAVSNSQTARSDLDRLLREQERAPIPTLYGGRIERDPRAGGQIRAGVGRIIDLGEQVVVLFSVLNSTGHAVLLMPPQVQLGGRVESGGILRHRRWTTADQLPVADFRLSRRRLGTGERADGVVVFERPPYKQSNQSLFLQVAEAGAVDRPALAPIGFGVSTTGEEEDGRAK